MDVSPVLVADLQAPEAVEPGELSFDHPGKYCRRHGGAEHLIFNQRRTLFVSALVDALAGQPVRLLTRFCGDPLERFVGR